MTKMLFFVTLLLANEVFAQTQQCSKDEHQAALEQINNLRNWGCEKDVETILRSTQNLSRISVADPQNSKVVLAEIEALKQRGYDGYLETFLRSSDHLSRISVGYRLTDLKIHWTIYLTSSGYEANATYLRTDGGSENVTVYCGR